MDSTELARDVETLWLWIAGPALLLAGVVLSVRLRAPQLVELGRGLRALRNADRSAGGALHPAASTLLATLASFGAAGAVGTATAVALGGPGAIAWVWLFTFLLAPLRMAEAALARTAPPGRAGGGTFSLAGRLIAEPNGALRALGWTLLVLVPLAAFAFVGGVHGAAVADAAEQLLPGRALALTLGVAALAALGALLPLRRAGALLGWIGAAALLVLLAAALVAAFSEPGRALTSLGRAVVDVFSGAPSISAFSGATAGEIASAAVLHFFPPAGATGAVEGALHAEAQAESTRRHARTALLGPLAYAVVTTVLGIAFGATGAFHRPVEGERLLRELTVYQRGFASLGERRDPEQLYTGVLRIENGSMGELRAGIATERGTVRTPTFFDRGEPADVFLRFRDGRLTEVQRKGELGAFDIAPESAFDEITVRGTMIPRGGHLLAESLTRGGGSLVARFGLVGLLVLAALGAAAWGIGVAGTLRAKLPTAAARVAGIVPAAGIAVAAAGVVPGLAVLGAGAAALVAIVAAVALVARANEAARITK